MSSLPITGVKHDPTPTSVIWVGVRLARWPTVIPAPVTAAITQSWRRRPISGAGVGPIMAMGGGVATTTWTTSTVTVTRGTTWPRVTVAMRTPGHVIIMTGMVVPVIVTTCRVAIVISSTAWTRVVRHFILRVFPLEQSNKCLLLIQARDFG